MTILRSYKETPALSPRQSLSRMRLFNSGVRLSYCNPSNSRKTLNGEVAMSLTIPFLSNGLEDRGDRGQG